MKFTYCIVRVSIFIYKQSGAVSGFIILQRCINLVLNLWSELGWEVLGGAGRGRSCAVVHSDGRWNEGAPQAL